MVSLAQLVNTVDAAHKDEDNGGGEAAEEETLATANGAAGVGLDAADVAPHVVAKEDAKGEEQDDLQDESGEGDVDANVVGAGRDGGDGAAGGLQDEAEDISGDEEDPEEAGPDAGDVWGEEDDGAGEGHVDGGCEEDGAKGDEDNLDEEGAEGPGVAVEEHTADVADDFGEASGGHERGEPPGAPAETQVDMDEESKKVEDDEHDGDAEDGAILVDGPLDGTEVEGAVGAGAVRVEHAHEDVRAVVEAVDVLWRDVPKVGGICRGHGV